MSDRKLEGIDVIVTRELTKTGKFKRRRPTPDELRSRLAISDANIAASNRIRREAGLDPLAPNFYRQALVAAVERAQAVKPARKRKPTIDPMRVAAALYATEASWRTCEAVADALGLTDHERLTFVAETGYPERAAFVAAAYDGPAGVADAERIASGAVA